MGLRPLAACSLALALLAGAVLSGASGATPYRQGHAYFREGVAPPSTSKLVPLLTSGTTGGAYPVSSGETVRLYAASQYVAADPGFNQRWADFLASAPHGEELSTVAVVLHPLKRVQSICGAQALACYSPDSETIVAPAEDPAPELTAASILLHEYGHHVAASRNNDPWAAVDYGPKRWASAENVCRRTAEGELHPGDEEDNYSLNPGEAWAETYRMVAEEALGLATSPWEIVSRTFYPDEAALQAASSDVLEPWAGNTTTTVSGALRRAQKTRGITVATPHDGNTVVTIANRTRSRLGLRLVDPSGKTLTSATVANGRASSLRSSICGQRSLRLQLTRTAAATGAGSYSITVSKP